MEKKKETPQEIVIRVKKKVDEALKEDNCIIEVEAQGNIALGEQVIVLRPVIVYKGEK